MTGTNEQSVQTSQNIIAELRDRAFDSSYEQLAVALGRPVEQVQAIAEGSEVPDDDLVIKAHGIAQERGIEVSGE